MILHLFFEDDNLIAKASQEAMWEWKDILCKYKRASG